MLNSSWNLLNTVVKVKTERLYGYGTVLSIWAVYPHDHMADWQMQLAVYPASQESTIQYIASPEKC